MTYNPPYYAALIEDCGFGKAQDLYAYEMDVAILAKLVERYKPAVMSALEGGGLSVRWLDPSRFDEEIRTYLELYNSALEGTWGFTPLQEGEVKHIAAELRHVIAPEFVAFAMVGGKTVGAVLALLDYNQIIRKLNGRLFPFGLFRLMWGKERINVARALTVTMLPAFQQSGFAIVLLDRLVEAAKPWGLTGWEFSWVLESNTSSRGTLMRAGTKLAKTYGSTTGRCEADGSRASARRVPTARFHESTASGARGRPAQLPPRFCRRARPRTREQFGDLVAADPPRVPTDPRNDVAAKAGHPHQPSRDTNDTRQPFLECVSNRDADLDMRKILRAGEVDAAPRAVGHKALAVLRSEDDAFDKVRHSDERDAPVAVPVHDVDTGSSDGVEYFVHRAVACTEHGARTNNRDRQRAGVPRGRLLASEFAAPIVRDRQRRIAFHSRRLARRPRSGER